MSAGRPRRSLDDMRAALLPTLDTLPDHGAMLAPHVSLRDAQTARPARRHTDPPRRTR